MYDLIVIGGGPAGLTAALYARRANKTVLVIEKGSFGGQITYSPKVENIPGFTEITGNEFGEKMVEQVLAQEAEVECAEVLEVKDGVYKTVVTDSGEFTAKSLVIATGAKHRLLGLPGEEKYIGEGISFCAVCDGAFYEGKEVAVIGGGNSALQEAVLLSEGCSKVYVIQNLDYFTGEAKLVEKLKAKDNVEFIMGTVITALKGEKTLEGLTLKKEADGSESDLKVDGLFVAIGLIPNNKAFADIAGLDEWGYIDSDESCITKTAGVFVAGDCRKKQIRQITTAAADGSVAALAACRYIDSL
jgi:thioredoxin reductase (NADPH)